MAKWNRTNHRLTVTPRALALEILAELQISSTPIMRYYEEHGYQVSDNESVEDLIIRTVRAHVIYGEDGDIFGQLKELRYKLRSIEWADDGSCQACDSNIYPDKKHTDDCWLDKELKR